MTVCAHKTNIVLFPLCDKSGVMSQALQPVGLHSTDSRLHRAGTRPDAIVFAWVLDLPTGIEPLHAARALLDATRHQMSFYNPYQLSVVAELAKLIEQESSGKSSKSSLLTKGRKSKYRRGRKAHAARQNRAIPDTEWRNFICLSGGLERSDEQAPEG